MDINPRFTEDYLPNRNAIRKNYQTSGLHFSLNDPNYMISFGGWHAYFGQLEGTIFIKKKKQKKRLLRVLMSKVVTLE